MGKLKYLLSAILLLVSTQAGAQVLVKTTQPITYTSLPSPTILATTGDENEYTVTPPFPIQFYGSTFTTITVGDNVAILFPGGLQVSLINETPGSTVTPNGFIAPFWDDQAQYAANMAYIGHQTQGTAPNRTFTVEWFHNSRYPTTATQFSVEVRFFEGQQRYEIDYGDITGTGTYNATMGMEDPAGGNPFFFAPSNCVTLCSQADFAAVSNMRVIIAQPITPELTGSFGTNWPRGAFPGMTATGNLILRNLATNTATAVLTRVYLSTDGTLDASDPMVGSITTPTLPNGNTTAPVTITVPNGTPVGDYYLFARIDANDAWSEINESDNVFAGPRFATAYELQPTRVSTSLPGINPGATATFDVEITNNGVPRVGSLDISVYASVDDVLDGMDRFMFTGTVNLTGANVETAPVSGTAPNLAPGSYYAIAVVDPMNTISETNEANNTVVSVMPIPSGPDFSVAAVTVPASVVPGGMAAITTTLGSLSVPFTGNVTYRLWASTDQMVGNDTLLGNFTATFAGEASLPDTENVLFPAQLATGSYYVIAQVDPTNAIAEVSETNNMGVSATAILNGPDFRITSPTFTPATAQVGNTITVNATLNSIGVPFTGNVGYGVFISPNPEFDPGDVLIYSSQVLVSGLSTAPISANFALPTVVPGTYTLFVVADPANTIAEANETNNATAGPGSFTVQGADLRVASITGDPVAFIGRTYQVTLTIENTGVADARGFQYAYYLSEDQAIRVFDTQVLISGTATIAAGAQQTFVDTLTFPTFTATTSLYLGVLVDIYSRVPETNPNNNIGHTQQPLRIVFPIPDLAGSIVETATAAAAGEQLAITRQITNAGVADAMSFSYRYYLSTNAMISTDDIELGRFNLSLPEGGDDYGVDVLTVPSNVSPGTYYLGMIVDPDDLLDEVDEENNVALGPQIPVYRAAIQFVTDRLPNGITGVPYQVGVYARGGPLPITWSVQSGALPAGLTIGVDSGIIGGTPTSEGVSQFVLRASSGTAYADKAFSMRITSPTVQLEIATPSLPSAIAGRSYRATLIAVGGVPPYTWEAISTLPSGITLTSAGVLSGVPTTPGNLPITVSVRDAINSSDSKALVLAVLNANQAVQITQVPLPKAIVGMPYCEPEAIRFEAQNGVPPYGWSLIGEVPAGMSMSATGEFCGAPETAGEFPIVVRAQDATGLYDTALFIFEVSGGNSLTISTFTLPGGKVGEDYSQKLTAVRGTEPYAWSVVEGAGDMPAGLTLAEDGSLSGSPTEDGLFAFVVQVHDAQLRTDTQPLSIQVAPAPKVEPGDTGCGCSASSGSATFGSLWAMLAVGALLALRKRQLLWNRLLSARNRAS